MASSLHSSPPKRRRVGERPRKSHLVVSTNEELRPTTYQLLPKGHTDMNQRVTFKANGHTTEGYLAKPGSGKGPGVIVLQEWWGLVPHIEDIANRFAAEGFFALAPDLYHGEKATGPDRSEERRVGKECRSRWSRYR